MKKIEYKLLASIFQKYPQIKAVYLFGSWAEGKNRQYSDIDLAIVPQGPPIRSQKLHILTDLAKIGFCNVDLVFLDTNDIVLKYGTCIMIEI